MPSVTLAATARCLNCAWTATGDPATVDKQAQKHARTGHATATEMRPA